MVIIRVPERGSEAPKRRLPIQIANETRMIEATIDLLDDHQVDEITSRMIAQASGTATNYISRYFGGRDGLLLAVATELGHRISGRIRAEESILEVDRPGNYVSQIMAIPEVARWFKVYRYLSGRNLPDMRPRGKPPVVSAVEEAITLIFGLEGDYVPVFANIFLTYIVGNAAFGPFLGTTDDDADAALGAMGDLVNLMVERIRNQASA
jgi:AcrR family transcriptional regulator